jgi:hypothetical protein
LNFKEIVKTALSLISSPAKAWEEIRLEEDRQKVFTAFVYPMIGLCTLAVFIGSLLTNGWGGPESFRIAMKDCCVVAVSLFGGYFLAAYIINALGVKVFGLPNDRLLAQQFAGYALVATFLVHIVTGLLPEFGFIALIFQFYMLYIVWAGADVLMNVKESRRLNYTLAVFLLLMLCPISISTIFGKLLVILS